MSNTNTDLSLKWLSSDLKDDFYRIMNDAGGEAAHCHCTAYYGVDWEKGGSDYRAAMFERGEMDGALLYLDSEPIGWAQCAPLGGKLVISRSVTPEAGDWGMSCLIIRPEFRRKGYGRRFFEMLMATLPYRGAKRIVAIGRKPTAYDNPDEFVEFPEEICKQAGMELIRDHDICPIYAKRL